MGPARLDVDTACWAADGCPLKVEYSASVIEGIRAAAVEGLCRFPRGGIEIGGVLFGTIEGGSVRIAASRPVQIEYALGPSFLLSENDDEAFRRTLGAAAEEESLKGFEVVGWYHSHTRSDLALSSQDLEVHERYFPEQWQVALLVRPEPFGTARASFFYRGRDGMLRPEAASEFLLTPSVSAARPRGRSQRLVETPESAPPPTAPPVVMTAVAPQVAERVQMRERLGVRPAGAPMHPRSRRRWVAATAALALTPVLAAGVLWWIERERATPGLAFREPLAQEPEPPPPQRFDVAARANGIPAAAVKEEAPPARDRVEPAPAPKREAPRPTAIEPKRESTPQRPAPRQFVLAQLRPPPRAQNGSLSLPPALQTGSVAIPQNGVTAPSARIPEPPPPTPMTVKPAPAKQAYEGPRAGRLIWTGHLGRGQSLALDGGRASAGNVRGELPGVPVRISVYPAELSSRGMKVYTSNQQLARAAEPPSRRNGWNATTYELSPERARYVVVVDPPSQQGDWKRFVVRSEAEVSVILIDWKVVE